MRDELPKKARCKESAIVNLNKSNEEGSHWVAYCKNGKKVDYFDSFGQLAPFPELVEYLKNCKISYNNLRYQNFDQSTCGSLCVLFLKKQLKQCPTY